MILYKCRKCGAVFEETEIISHAWREYRGECHGFPAYETMCEDHCPRCYDTDLQEYWEDEDVNNESYGQDT